MKFDPAVSAAIVSASTRFGVDPCFLAAIVMQESSGNTWAVRYEKDYRWLMDVETGKPFTGSMNPATFPAPDGVSSWTEWISQHTSWGLGQVMGATARDLLYAEKFLSGLCDPATGAEYAARLIARIMEKYKDLRDVASAYNAGSASVSNQATYVTPVMTYYGQYQQAGF